MMRQFIIVSILIVLTAIDISGQEIPKIIAFNRDQYKADHQNWMIASDCDGLLYVANSEGVLIFNGFNWQLIRLPKFRKARSVYRGNDCKIYVGGFETFGYIDIGIRNKPQFFSLADSLLESSSQEIWNIFGNENKIVFQSFSTLYEYDYSTLKSRIPPTNIMFGKVISEEIYLPKIEGGIYKVLDDRISVIPESLRLPPHSKVAAICKGKNDDEIIIGTQYEGLYTLSKNRLTKVDKEINEIVSVEQINRMYKLNNGLIAIGTILNGLYIIDEEFNIKFHINKSNGLSNNTILSLYENEGGDLWVGLDKGLNLIKVSDPINYYYDIKGQLGTFFCHANYNGDLFIGTNQGVFKKSVKNEFHLIPGTQGQAWCLREINQMLICGHNSGSYIIEGGGLKNIYSSTGVWWIEKIGEDKILQSTYTGLSMMELKNNQWNEIAGFDTLGIILQRFLKVDDTIYGFNPQNTAYVIQIDTKNNKIIDVYSIDKIDGHSITSNLHFIPYNNKVYAIMDNFIFEIIGKEFKLIKENTQIEGLLHDSNFIAYKISQIIGESVPRFYNYHINTDKYLLGFNEGYVSIPKDYTISSEYNDSIYIDFITVNEKPLDYIIQNNVGLSYDQDNMHIQLGTHQIPDKFDFFEYKLENWQSQWFPLEKDGSIEFFNLPSKEYSLLIRNGLSGQPIELLNFEIKPIWYTTWKGYLLLILFIYGLLKIISIRHDKKLKSAKEKLEREKLEEIENEKIRSRTSQLERELTHKRKLLANSALTIAQKNKMLNKLKSFVQNNSISEENSYQNKQKLLHLIEMNLKSDHEWEIFEQNFEEVHEDFLENLKVNYPDLTSGDLRLAAYIKMGLSSKEIAPLLNISIRSVENKRYRLRKKMNLPGEANLSDRLMRL